MLTDNPYLAVQNLSLLQRQAGVDPEVTDLVCAYARLRANAGKSVVFYDEQASLDDLSRQFIHRRLVSSNSELDPRFLSFLVVYGNQLAARGLPVVYSVEHLAQKRRMSEKQLRWMALNARLFYKEFKIGKANGGTRTILAPQGRLLTHQRWILRKILDRTTPHKYACGFVKGRSILDNARPHVGRKVVIRIDLQDFFPSISHRQVRKVFEQLGYPYRVASLLANLCTVDGFLPQGAPTSPALSNMVCGKLDRRFAGLKEKLKFRYSRYADDLVFSSDDDRLPNLIPFFKQVLREEGFAVNQGKIRIMRQGQQQKVTGIVVNQKTSVDREHVRKLRAAVHRLKTQGPEAIDIKTRPGSERDPLYVLRGHLSFVRMVRGDGGCGMVDGKWGGALPA